ncbi:MAG: MoaD/ThiS family protein, partial [Gammaproteobacteria bacterium]|nr:MoaD/ThiS family protein [Gammaproteobacteria bacterium]
MKISVKYFASMRDRVGKDEESLELSDGATIAELWGKVSEEELPENTLVAINMEYTNSEAALKDGDEVAFFPPV